VDAKISNSVQTYQLLVDRNIALKNREDELHNTISELEAKQTELQRTLDLNSKCPSFKTLMRTTQT
jgi:hypothetical protein